MESKTTIEKLFQGNHIAVPKYQRAYSWESPKKNISRENQTEVFLQDLDDYINSNSPSAYYFGHFLFEHTNGSSYNVIDGQQRLTTITIFLAALFEALEKKRSLSEEEEITYENIIRRRSIINFSTVDYDNLIFRDYVINHKKEKVNRFDTQSSKRIVEAFDYFRAELATKDEVYLTRLLDAVRNASCTTHKVEDEAEAIQMFIFQNNRGKKPTNLEVVKAQFMYHAHLYGGEEADFLINDIKDRFEKIYKSISGIEYKMNEDDVLVYTLRVYFNSLTEENALTKIEKSLSEAESLKFIGEFTHSLTENFENLTIFFGEDERNHFEIHSLITLGGFGIIIPFILKAYKFGLDKGELTQLTKALESIVVRHRLIGTRADLISRINGEFKGFSSQSNSIQPILERINHLKNVSEGWWAYWNDESFRNSLNGDIKPGTAKFLLWKYENSLNPEGKNGYSFIRYNNIEKPELEHISPQTEPPVQPHGYGVYNEEFYRKHLDCLGNYVLISKSHNCSIGNVPFWEKHKSYDYLKQQQEIKKMAPQEGPWDKELIQARNKKITNYILEHF